MSVAFENGVLTVKVEQLDMTIYKQMVDPLHSSDLKAVVVSIPDTNILFSVPFWTVENVHLMLIHKLYYGLLFMNSPVKFILVTDDPTTHQLFDEMIRPMTHFIGIDLQMFTYETLASNLQPMLEAL